MKKLLIAFAAVLAIVSCREKSEDFSGMTGPEIELVYTSLNPDLNRVDNTPVVCIIFSEAGLQSVTLSKMEAGEESVITTVTEFRDIHQHSFKENPVWNTDITSVTILAVDRAGQKASVTIDVTVTPVLPAPEIDFELDGIEINEREEDPNEIETRFEVTSSNTLQSVKVALFTAEGIVDVPLTPAFHAGEASYSFEQTITYLEGYRGLQVTATDGNGKMKIETLPINYIPAPAPVLTPKEGTSVDPLVIRSTESKTFGFSVECEAGLSSIEVFKITKDVQGKDVQNRLDVAYYNPESDFSVDYEFTAESFDTDGHAIEFVATDKLGHEGTVKILTILDMRMKENILIGSHKNAKSPLVLEGFEGQEAYCFFSVADFKTYSLYYFWEAENRRNIDFFYFVWNANGASDNGSRLMKANEERSGQDPEQYLADTTAGIPELGQGSDWGNRNGTYIKRLTDTFNFDFDNVTPADLTSSAVQTYVVQAKTNPDWINYKPGDCFLFKTGPLSTCPDCTGIARFELVEGSRSDFSSDKPVYTVISIKALIVE